MYDLNTLELADSLFVVLKNIESFAFRLVMVPAALIIEDALDYKGVFIVEASLE